MQLPEVKNLEYRFCPECGAEISAKPKRLDEAFLTIPPELPAQKPEQTPNALDPETGQKVIFTGKLNDKTIAPQSMDTLQQPALKPPDAPPPSSFYRISSVEKPHSPSASEKAPPKKDIRKPPPTQNRKKIIIAALAILALIILVLGGLFTF
jgi:hypothetical protein